MRKALLLIGALLLATGCPDPAGTDASTTATTTAADPNAPTDAANAGVPTSPNGVQPGIQAPPTGFSPKEGEGVALSGTITYEGSKTGRIRIDFLKVSANQPPQLAHTTELGKYGEWSVNAPKEFGDLRVVGFLDQTGDGPSKDDPAFAFPEVVTIKGEPVANVDLVLSDTPNLGDLTPGSAPPAGTGTAPKAPAAGASAPGETPAPAAPIDAAAPPAEAPATEAAPN